jgi:hypothetical protein
MKAAEVLYRLTCANKLLRLIVIEMIMVSRIPTH